MNMARDERHQEQTRSAARARNKALRDLARLYPSDYRVLYEKHALAEGILPRGARNRMLHKALQEENGQS